MEVPGKAAPCAAVTRGDHTSVGAKLGATSTRARGAGVRPLSQRDYLADRVRVGRYQMVRSRDWWRGNLPTGGVGWEAVAGGYHTVARLQAGVQGG